MKSLLKIILGLVISWYFTDIESDSVFFSVLAPLGVAVCFISFFVWLVLQFQKRGMSHTASRGGGSSGFDGFGDGGGGDC